MREGGREEGDREGGHNTDSVGVVSVHIITLGQKIFPINCEWQIIHIPIK